MENVSKKGSDERRLKSSDHQRKIYKLLSKRRMNRAEIKDAIGMSKNQIAVYIRTMLSKGQIIEHLEGKTTEYTANPDNPYVAPNYIEVLVSRRARKDAKNQAELMSDEEESPEYIQQVNAYTRIIRLTNNRLATPAPKKKAKASKFVSMGSGMLMFSNWE
jgi:hypothetical protein